MVTMLGERVLPESVNSARRRLRNRLMQARQPIRQRREQLVPGPDVIGMAESQFQDLRSRVVSREGLLSRVRSQQEQMTNKDSSSGSSGNTPAT